MVKNMVQDIIDDLITVLSINCICIWLIDVFQIHSFGLEALLSILTMIVTFYICKKYFNKEK